MKISIKGPGIKIISSLLMATVLVLSMPVLTVYGTGQTLEVQSNSTTLGSLTLVPTFRTISVYSGFSGDVNENNQATLKYKVSGSNQWITAHPLTVDRRETIVSGGSSISNPYNNQWRGSILFLEPDMEYKIRVEYADPDGVSGSPVTATVTTRIEDIPLGSGNTYYVATDGNDDNPGTEVLPFQTIQHAADLVVTGDTVIIKGGTYNEKVTITASGTAGNYITFMPYGDDEVIIDGQSTLEYGVAVGVSGIVGTGAGTREGGHYVRVSGLKIIDSKYAGINVGGNNVFIENCEIRDFNRADALNADHRASGITVRNWGTANLTARNNLIVRDVGTPGFDSPMGIHIWNDSPSAGGGHIIYGNRIITAQHQIRDGIGGLRNFSYPGSFYHDSDIYNNYIEGVYDDGIESEGGNVNVRIWGNIIKDPGNMGFGIGATIIGPLYICRNTVCGFADSAVKMGHESTGTIYIYHNTFYTTAFASGPSDFAGTGVENVISRNNIYQVGKYVIEIGSGTDAGNSYDYDNMFTTDPGRFVKWYGSIYPSLDSFQTGAGQELNAISADSKFADPSADNLTLQQTSPCIDRGVVIPGFNDAESSWLYQGTAPDLGAHEFFVMLPVVITDDADNITASSATLHGTLDSLGGYDSASVSFEWGLNTGYGNETDPQTMNTIGSFSDTIVSLDPGTTYHFRARAEGDGITHGEDITFTTCIPGDANDDGVIDFLDLQVEKQMVLGESPPTCGADANQDGVINILDMAKIKGIILGLTP